MLGHASINPSNDSCVFGYYSLLTAVSSPIAILCLNETFEWFKRSIISY